MKHDKEHGFEDGCNTEMICVEDFCGNSNKFGKFHHQLNFWADWCPKCKATYFGGYWTSIPDFPSLLLPDFDDKSEELQAHIDTWEPVCEKAYWDYIMSESVK